MVHGCLLLQRKKQAQRRRLAQGLRVVNGGTQAPQPPDVCLSPRDALALPTRVIPPAEML